MEIKCTIDQVKTLKKGMKITLSIADENVKGVMKDIYNFIDRDLIVDLSIDAVEEKEKLNQISADQRKKIYALFNDIANHTGNNKETVKDEMKTRFMQNTDYPHEELSLASISREAASDFIEYIIEFCFEWGIEITDMPKEAFDDIEKYLQVCLRQKKCAVCGSEAETHHIDTIGAGHDRNKVDDSDKRKIALCRQHHSEAHNIGWQTFADKYKVKGVK